MDSRYEFSPSGPSSPPPPLSDEFVLSCGPPLLVAPTRHSGDGPSETYRFYVMREEHIASATYVLGYCFVNTPTEGLHHGGAQYSEVADVLEIILRDRIVTQGQELSFVAVDEDNDVVGVFFHELGEYCLTGDSTSLPVEALRLMETTFIWQVGEQVMSGLEEEEYRKWVESWGITDFSRAMGLFCWAVLPSHRGNRLTATALELAEQFALKHHMQCMFVICSNHFSASLCERKGAIRVAERVYADYSHIDPRLAKVNQIAVKWLKQEGLWKDDGLIDEQSVTDRAVMFHFDLRECPPEPRPRTPWERDQETAD